MPAWKLNPGKDDHVVMSVFFCAFWAIGIMDIIILCLLSLLAQGIFLLLFMNRGTLLYGPSNTIATNVPDIVALSAPSTSLVTA